MYRRVIRIAMAACLVPCLASPVLGQTTHTVDLVGIEFVPEDITIAVGDTVHWVWVSGGLHNVESGTVQGGSGVHDGNFNSGTPVSAPGPTFTFTFDQAFLDAHPMPGNSYPYYCLVHAAVGMVGTVTVTEPACGSNQECDDGLFCTGAETCDPSAGCTSTGNPCDASEFCNEADDRCDECVSNGDCDDGVGCTLDTCTAGACSFAADSSLCQDDGAFCNGAEVCDLTAGCVSQGNPCGSGRTCNEAEDRCEGCGADADCDDGVACTDDLCDAGTCVFVPNDANCPQDSLFCTAVMICDAEEGCIAGAAPCPPGAFCNEATDACDACASGQACDDGNPCTEDDVCAAGICAGSPISACCTEGAACDDGDACTEDSCIDQVCTHVDIAGCGEPEPQDPPDDDGAEGDADADGVIDEDDLCPDTPAGAEADQEGCACEQRDADGDGVDDCTDSCDQTPTGATVGETGCADSQLDDDGDGVTNDVDSCSETETGREVDAQGCSPEQNESDTPEPANPTPPRRFCGALGAATVLWLVTGWLALHSRRRGLRASAAWCCVLALGLIMLAGAGGGTRESSETSSRSSGAASRETYEYIGMRRCKMCHANVYKSWQASPKGDSWEALLSGSHREVKLRAGLDPEADYTADARCLDCHAVGHGEPGGYVIPESGDEKMIKAAEQRQGAGCESCHGPGSGFVEVMREVFKEKREYHRSELEAVGRRVVTREVCQKCHNESAVCMEGAPNDEWKRVDVSDRHGFHKRIELEYRVDD